MTGRIRTFLPGELRKQRELSNATGMIIVVNIVKSPSRQQWKVKNTKEVRSSLNYPSASNTSRKTKCHYYRRWRNKEIINNAISIESEKKNLEDFIAQQKGFRPFIYLAYRWRWWRIAEPLIEIFEPIFEILRPRMVKRHLRLQLATHRTLFYQMSWCLVFPA